MGTIPTLYHYCPPEAFISIISNKCLWMSHYSSMNDSLEIKWTSQLVENAIGDEDIDKIEQIKESLVIYQPKAYITSCTEAGDLLSQWRAYAEDGSGYSIGFSPAAFKWNADGVPYPSGSSDMIGLVKVIYETNLQLQKITSLIDSFRDNGDIYDPGIVGGILRQMSICFKNMAFSEEQEWRFIHSPYIVESEPDDPDLPPRFEIRGPLSPLLFRNTNRGLAAFFEFPFKPLHAIREVILGPKNKTNKETVLKLLRSNGFRSVKILRSKVPYR